MGVRGATDFGATRNKQSKCGSKTVWMVLMIVCFLVGGILAIVPWIVGACPECCGSDCENESCYGNCEDVCKVEVDDSFNYCLKAKSGAYPSTGAWWASFIIGIIFVIFGCVFTCGACNCCCFKGDDAGAPPTEMDDDAVEVAAE